MTTGARRTGRPPGKQGADLLDTARQAFLERGLDGTTMSDIAAEAGISKASLYGEHESKHALFVAVVTDWTSRGRGSMRPHLEALIESDDVERDLLDFAAVLSAAILSPEVTDMRRLVAAEARRFPDVADVYLETSWQENIAALAAAFAAISERGHLVVDDPQTAAEQFVWLTVGRDLNAVTIAGQRRADSAGHVDDAVRTFLARYGV